MSDTVSQEGGRSYSESEEEKDKRGDEHPRGNHA